MSINKPFIALTSQYNANNEKMEMRSRYFDIITLCGGIPVPLPQVEDINDIRQYANKFDGFLFSGGDDVNPKLFGEAVSPDCGFISDERDTFEIALLHEVIKLNKPIFGICRGIQVVNVGLGGSLYQHMEGHSKGVRHDVILDNASPLYELYATDKINVNSYHHQAVKDIAPSLKVAGHTEDGYVEALYMPNYKYLTLVQWHPEILTDADYNSTIQLITDFINACID